MIQKERGKKRERKKEKGKEVESCENGTSVMLG